VKIEKHNVKVGTASRAELHVVIIGRGHKAVLHKDTSEIAAMRYAKKVAAVLGHAEVSIVQAGSA